MPWSYKRPIVFFFCFIFFFSFLPLREVSLGASAAGARAPEPYPKGHYHARSYGEEGESDAALQSWSRQGEDRRR